MINKNDSANALNETFQCSTHWIFYESTDAPRFFYLKGGSPLDVDAPYLLLSRDELEELLRAGGVGLLDLVDYSAIIDDEGSFSDLKSFKQKTYSYLLDALDSSYGMDGEAIHQRYGTIGPKRIRASRFEMSSWIVALFDVWALQSNFATIEVAVRHDMGGGHESRGTYVMKTNPSSTVLGRLKEYVLDKTYLSYVFDRTSFRVADGSDLADTVTLISSDVQIELRQNEFTVRQRPTHDLLIQVDVQTGDYEYPYHDDPEEVEKALG